MRKFSIILFLLGFWLSGDCAIVINELFYDAVGSDDGKEWIELYNNGLEDVNLQGWTLQAGGTVFADVYVFSNIMIRAGAFFLISESSLPLANLVTELGFENGGSATDGVRIINHATHYSDTVLYDSPNTNNLPGDSLSQLPCPNANPGYSLARVLDGLDNNSTTDWYSCPKATPGSSNILNKIVTLGSCDALIVGANIEVSTVILNLSTLLVDKSELSIKIRFDGELKYFADLPKITENDSISLSTTISNEFLETGFLEVELLNNSNIEIVDNLWRKWISYENPRVILSEIMYYPRSNQSEWVELKLLNDLVETKISITDSSGNKATSVINGHSGDYVVIAESKTNVQNTFLLVDSLKVFQAQGWARLNNTGDTLIIKHFQTTLDSLQYANNSASLGHSLELDEASNIWQKCSSAEGASPTQAKTSTQTNPTGDKTIVKILNSLISQKKEKQFMLQFTSSQEVNSLELQLFDIKGRELSTIRINIPNQYTGEYSWNGYLQGKYLASGVYPVIIKIKAQKGPALEVKKTIITINR